MVHKNRRIFRCSLVHLPFLISIGILQVNYHQPCFGLDQANSKRRFEVLSAGSKRSKMIAEKLIKDRLKIN